MWAWWNGEFIDKDKPVIRLEDRGFTFGDGIFEVIRTINGRLLFYDEHLRRMRQSTAFFGIPFPYDPAVLKPIARELLLRNSVSDGELYLQLTRGTYPMRTHRFPPAGTNPTFFMLANPVRTIDPACWERGAAVCTYPDLRHGFCEHKTLDLLPNVLAKNYAFDRGGYDALLYREDEIGRYVTEGGSSSYFCVSDGEVITPALENILPGITRRKVLDLALEQGRRVTERRLRLSELLAADEVFLASTVSRVMPVGRIDATVRPAPGPVTRALSEAFDLLFRRELFD